MKINNDIKRKFDDVVSACIIIVNAKDRIKVNNAIADAANVVAVAVAEISRDYPNSTEDVCKNIYDIAFSAVKATIDIKCKDSISMAANAFTYAINAYANPGTFSAYGAANIAADRAITEFRNNKELPLGS